MCGCAHTRVQLFGELQREKTSYFALGCIILVTIGLRSLHEVKPGGGVEVKCLRELLSAFLIRGKWVTSSGLLDPAACLGSAAKTNEDPLKRSVPGTSRAGGWQCLAPYCAQTSAWHVESHFGTFRASAKHIYFGSHSRYRTHGVGVQS